MTRKRLLLYLLFLAAAFLTALVIRFPAERAGRLATAAVSARYPSLAIEGTATAKGVPPVLNFDRPVLLMGRVLSLPMDALSITLSLPDLVRAQGRLKFSARLFNGEITGLFSLSGAEDSLSFDRLQFKDLPLHLRGGDARTGFILSGRLDTGNGVLTLSDLTAVMPDTGSAAPGLGTLTFDRVDLEFQCGDAGVKIVKCRAEGPVLTLNLTGQILLPNRDPGQLPEAALNLSGSFLPKPAYLPKFASVSGISSLFQGGKSQGIPVKITGTLAQPEVML